MSTTPNAPRDSSPATDQLTVEHGELVTANDQVSGAAPAAAVTETITEPGKVMRIGSMVKQLLEEVRSGSLDEASRERVAEIYERSIVELQEAMSPDLQEELRSLALPFPEGAVPSESELRIAKAQLVGWLEGLFHGIQATLFAQQMAARQQFEQMRQLPPGAMPGQMLGGEPQATANDRPGTYL
ncbi:MAG: bacterial proteasome activator family protein [Ilumatobacteraceae bacterium]